MTKLCPLNSNTNTMIGTYNPIKSERQMTNAHLNNVTRAPQFNLKFIIFQLEYGGV